MSCSKKVLYLFSLPHSVPYSGIIVHNKGKIGVKGVLACFSCVLLFATLWTVAHQAPLSKRFSRQEYCSGLPFPSYISLTLWKTRAWNKFECLWGNGRGVDTIQRKQEGRRDKQGGETARSSYVCLLVLPQRSTTNWVTSTVKLHCLTVLEIRSPRPRGH